jgi:putative heme iron utilization protein
MTAGYEARRFLRGQRVGMLATLSLKLGGYPFGSVTPLYYPLAVNSMELYLSKPCSKS